MDIDRIQEEHESFLDIPNLIDPVNFKITINK